MLPCLDPRSKPEWGAELDLSHPLAAGLFGDFALLEGTGKTTANLAGLGQVGAFSSTAPTWGPGDLGLGLNSVQDGGQGVLIPAGGEFTRDQTDFSLACRVRLTGMTNGFTERLLMVLGDMDVDWGALLSVDYHGGSDYYVTLGVVTGGGRQDAQVNNFATLLDRDHVIVGTRIGTALSLYVDGVLVGTGTSNSGNLRSHGGNSSLGNSYSPNTGRTLPGRLDWARFWNRGLTAGEARQLYEEPYGLYLARPAHRFYRLASTPAPASLDWLFSAPTPQVQRIPIGY